MSKFFSQKSHRTFLLSVALGLATIVFVGAFYGSRVPSNQDSRAGVDHLIDKVPLSFEENRGQAQSDVDFISRNGRYTLYLASNEATVDFHNKRSSVKLKLVDAARKSEPEGLSPLPGKSNYFIGNDPDEWRTDIDNYARVRYRGVYPGIDLVYYGSQRRIEYDFSIAPQSDPKRVKIKFEGADKVKITDDGALTISSGNEVLTISKPYVYQDIDGSRHTINCDFTIDPLDQVGFEIGDYDRDHSLIIDPIISYSTFLGGAGTDVGYGIAIDQQGNIYVTGQTASTNFPTKNPFDAVQDGINDAFITKLNPANGTIVYSTYIGGRNPGDTGWAVAVDKAGNAYFVGETNSLNFPTANAALPTYRGNGDAFAVKLNTTGNVLLYSTYLGGFSSDTAYGIALDRFDNAYITGRTDSTNFPLKNPLQSQLRGRRDAFVTRLNANGGIVFSTYLGGEALNPGESDEDVGYGIALDRLQNIYVTGYTTSPNYPQVGAAQANFGGVADAFVSKISSDGSKLIYSTFLGGNRIDNGRGIAVDLYGCAYVTGLTQSADFPLAFPFQQNYSGNSDGFVTKINASGSKFVYSTFLGGSDPENNGLFSDNVPSCAITVDNQGYVYVTGKTESADFPVIRAVQTSMLGDNDAYIVKFDPSGSGLVYSTFLGSTYTTYNGFEERGMAIALDKSGAACITGQILKNDFVTVQPFQKNYGGGASDAFVARISTSDITGITAVSAASFMGSAYAPDSINAIFGENLASGIDVAQSLPLPTTLAGATVTVRDQNGVSHQAPLFFASPEQVNFLIPPEIPLGKATITVTNGLNTGVETTVWINNVAPALFSANANGQGVPAAVLLRIQADGTQIYEPVAAINITGKYDAIPIDMGPESDQVFIILFGTGVKGVGSESRVTARIGDVDAQVLYAGPQGVFIGQDQINIQLPRSLARKGTVELNLIVDGMLANPVMLNFR